MNYKLFIFLFFIFSCSPQFSSSNKKPYTARGIAYIYNDLDFNENTIKGRMNNDILQVSHQSLRTGVLIKIINPENSFDPINAVCCVFGYFFLYSIALSAAPLAE